MAGDLTYHVIVVGSGPAGVSAAARLLDRGLKVLMLDQGRLADIRRQETGNFGEIRESGSDRQWRELLGADLGSLDLGSHATPKMKIPQHRFVQRGFPEAYGLTGRGVRVVGSLAAGGLSNMWGAGVFAYDDGDLTGFPLDAAALAEPFRRVADRIGVSGSATTGFERSLGDFELMPTLPLHPNASALLDHHVRRAGDTGTDAGFSLGRTRNAVSTVPRPGRGACQHDKMCLWGCRHGAIYTATHDLALLVQRAGFTYRPGSFVRSLERLATEGGYRLICEDLDNPSADAFAIEGRKVVLAAGSLGTTVLAADALGLQDVSLPILSHPALGLAFVLPTRIGTKPERAGFALGQLCYKVEGECPGDDAFGVMFSGDSLLASDLCAHMPLSRRGAAATAKALVPAMMLANCYLPSDYAQCSITITGTGRGRSAALQARYSDSFATRSKEVSKRVARAMLKLGAVLLPGGARTAELGSDGHMAGGIPMLDQPGDRRLSSDANGEIRGLPGVFASDGASLTRLAGKHPTFLIMGNADRIADGIADRFGQS